MYVCRVSLPVLRALIERLGRTERRTERYNRDCEGIAERNDT